MHYAFISFAPFDSKTDPFTKTASGQTQGKALKNEWRFLAQG
jgi:hypothetical protein